MLCRDPQKRLGYLKDAEDIKSHIWFKGINWKDVYERKLSPPKMSYQISEDDFFGCSRFENEKELMSSFNSQIFLNWTFVGEEL